MDFEGILVVDLPILRYPFADVRHHALYLFDSAESTSAVVVKFLLSHEVDSYCLCHVHFLVQVFDLGRAVPHGLVEEGSVRSDIPVRGEIASEGW
jgi:hypothetical protein